MTSNHLDILSYNKDILHSLGFKEEVVSIEPISSRQSAVFIVRSNQEQIRVLKFRTSGGRAEYDFLNTYHHEGVNVFCPRGIYVMPDGSTYMLMDPILDNNGNLAKAINTRSYELESRLSKLILRSLVLPSREFGGYLDNNPEFKVHTMNEYILKYLTKFHNILCELFDSNTLRRIYAIVDGEYADKPALCHGDLNYSNVLMRDAATISYTIIDPNPMLLDMCYDFAKFYNSIFSHPAHLNDRDTSLVTSFASMATIQNESRITNCIMFAAVESLVSSYLSGNIKRTANYTHFMHKLLSTSHDQ